MLVQGHPLPRRAQGAIKEIHTSSLNNPILDRRPRLRWAAREEAQDPRAAEVARLGAENPAASVSIDRARGLEPRGVETGRLRLRLRRLRGRKMPMTTRRRKRKRRRKSHTIPTRQIPGTAEGYQR